MKKLEYEGNNPFTFINFSGAKIKCQFDDSTNNLYYEDTKTGLKKSMRYNKYGEIIDVKYIIGYEEWFRYSTWDNMVRVSNILKDIKDIEPKEETPIEKINEYDDEDAVDIVHLKYSNGCEEWWDNSKYRMLICRKRINGTEASKELESMRYKGYNEHDRFFIAFDRKSHQIIEKIHLKTDRGYEEHIEYDDNHNITHYKNSIGEEW